MREAKVRPIPIIPRRAGRHLHDPLGQFLLRLVVCEDVFKVEVLRRKVQSIKVGLVEQFALGVGEGHIEARGAGVGDQLHFGGQAG